jgi:hypothetical protein
MNTTQRTFHKGAIGSDDVKRLIESGDYVDKSLFIKDILHDNHQVLLITRPRRWGKSSNMSLLKTFLELEVDKEGNPLPQEKKTNPAYFTGGLIGEGKKQVAHEALKISKEADSMEELGQYPVIMMSFKDIVCSSYETIEAGIQDVLGFVFSQHKYLMFSEHLDTNEKNRLSGYLKGELDLAHLQKIIKDLLSFLYNHFNQKVWVLIDEYDNAIHKAYFKFGQSKENPYQFSVEFNNVLELFRNVMGPLLKSATHLEKGVVTGILRIAKANLFSEINNFTEYSVLDKKFARYYGFTQEEVDMLCQQQNVSEDKKEEIKQWYNGYSYGGLELYNPWSMVRCLFSEEHEIKNYWEESGSFGFLTKIMIDDDVQKEIQNFMRAPYCQETVFVNNYIDLASLLQAYTQTVVSLLLHSGYLNPKDGQRIGNKMAYTLSIPNQEIITAFDSLIKKWTAKKLGAAEGSFNNIEIALYKGDVSLFKERLKAFLHSATSFNIIKKGAIKLRESHYHFLMNAILYGMHITNVAEQEKESGRGRVDTIIVPKLYQGTQAIILEYKYSQQEGDLAKTAQEALAQITDQKYIATIVGEKHVKSVLQLGIAFHKKEVEVVHEIVQINA